MKKLVTLVATAALASTSAFGVAVTAHAAGVTTAASSASGAPAASASFQEKLEWAVARANLSPELKAKVLALGSRLPADQEQRLRQLAQRYGVSDTPWAELINQSIDPGDYVCATTPLSTWLDTQIDELDFSTFFILYLFGGLDLPTYDALLLGKESKANSFGLDGSYTNELTRTMTNLRGFWDVNGKDIQLMPMKGKQSFADLDRMAFVLSIMYDATPADVMPYAELIQALVNRDPAMRGGDHPIFTFNAFAFDPTGEPELEQLGLTKRIIMGDGIMAGMKAVGLDVTAPRSILSHEYGHQVQYAKHLFDSPLTGPEATRRTELMADALGTYFMTHKRGQAINDHKVLQDEQSFYNVGDCSFTSEGHHGTPNQRLASSKWAVSVVKSQPNQGHKVGGATFGSMFDAVLPKIVAPDAK